MDLEDLSTTDQLAALGISHERAGSGPPYRHYIRAGGMSLGLADFQEANNLARFIREREAPLLKAAKRALATLRAEGHRSEQGNVLEALERAIAKAERCP